MAISTDTIIHTLVGDVPLKKLAARGEVAFGFVWDGSKITAGTLRFGEIRAVEVLRVLLDNGRSVYCSADTEFAERLTQAAALPAEQLSVLPLYLKLTRGYPFYRQLRLDRGKAPARADRATFRSVARMVYEWKTGERLPSGVAVRHRDGNRRNCLPDNLYKHGKPTTRTTKANKFMRLRDLRQSLISNHKIVGVEPFGEDEVGDVYTEAPSFFFAASEVFVKGKHGSS